MSIHRFVLHNGKIKENTDALLAPGQLGLLAGWGVFSTLRVLQGELFAWERHWARMTRDARAMNVPMPADSHAVAADLMALAGANGAPDCTLRVVIVRNSGGAWEGPARENSSDVIALTADFKNWGSSVRLGVQPHARHAAMEFSGAKILSWSQNLTWLERAQTRGFDEVLLLNEYGRIAECTSANVFAVHGRQVTTPALTEGCLPGITREILLELGGIQEGTLTVQQIHDADEVFITSSTRGLLPAREIEGRELRTGREFLTDGEVRSRLAESFAAYLHDDIARRVQTPVLT